MIDDILKVSQLSTEITLVLTYTYSGSNKDNEYVAKCLVTV